jgi:mono/diheme cytochrome c family protein
VGPWKTVSSTLAALPAIGAVAAFAFIRSGLYDVAASQPHNKFTEWLTHETMMHSVRLHASGIAAPARFTSDQVERGFCAYETHCVACHGAAGVAREPWAAGMEPAPPYLLDITQRFTSEQLFFVVKNGIKMTGMPAWRDSMPDDQIWDVVAFLEASRVMPPQTYLQWRSNRSCRGTIGLPDRGSASIPPPAPGKPTAATGGSAPSSPGSARP